MKKIALIVLLLSLWNISMKAQTCPPDQIILVTQSDVDSFPIRYPDCQALEAALVIGSELPNVSDIINLNALSQITAVNGALRITNTLLTNLNGLHNLDYVRYEVYIGNNSLLTDLGGFSDIHGIDGELRVNENPVLLSLNGFNNLSTVKGIQIVGNAIMTSINGLNNLKKVVAGIAIGFNPALQQLDAFHQLDSIGINGLVIYNNQSMTVLNAFEELLFIHTDLDLAENAALINLEGFGSLRELRTIEIYANDALTNLTGLGNLLSVESINLTGNESLTDLSALQNATGIKTLIISGNQVLSDLTGLVGLGETKYLLLNENPSIENLNGLQNATLLKSLFIRNNAVLTDISSLDNSNSLELLQIVGNPLLSNCSIYSICNFVIHAVGAQIQNNAPGCNDVFEVEIGCGAVPVFATVQLDQDGDCQADNNNTPLDNAHVHLSTDLQMSLRSTNEDGIARFGYLDNGLFLLDLPQFPTNNWMACQDTFAIGPANEPDTIHRTFLLKPLNQCPELSVELGLPPFFRGCLVNTTVTSTVTNVGTIPAEDVTVAIVMPAVLDLISSIPPSAGQSGDTLFFAVGNLAPFEHSIIQLVVKTSCDTFLFGQSLCLESFGELSNPCPISSSSNSEIRLFSQCVGDTTVRFTIKNVGNAGTQSPHEYVIIEDEIIMLINNFSLNPFGSMTVDVPSDGSTYRMEATKNDIGQKTATVQEGCAGLTPGFVTAYWFDRSLRNYDFDCREVILAYDPNEKNAVPKGIGSENLIEANTPIEYTIQFQNTGTDTAFRVLLLDVLPTELDVNTFRPGSASHPNKWEINDGRLKVLFSPIALPDSNINEPASHGFFNFSIAQKSNLPNGTILENSAAIIFDFNPPISTNTVIHTIGKLLVSIDEPQRFITSWKLSGNPTSTTATFSTATFVPGQKYFELVDVVGGVAQREQFSGQTYQFQRGDLNAGLYFFRITDDKGQVFAGRIMIAD